MANENKTPKPVGPKVEPEAQASAAPGSAGNEKPKSITPPIDMLAERMRLRVNKAFLGSKISTVDRNSINQLAGTLALQTGEKDKASARLEYLLCFLEGDIDWKKRYKEVFGLEPPKKKTYVEIPESLRQRSRTLKASGKFEEPDY